MISPITAIEYMASPAGGAVLGGVAAYYGVKYMVSRALAKAQDAKDHAADAKISAADALRHVLTLKLDMSDVKADVRLLRESHDGFVESLRDDRQRLDNQMLELNRDIKSLLRTSGGER